MPEYGYGIRDKQQDKPVTHCDRCQAELYREDDVYIWEGKWLCGECIEEKFSCMTTAEKAELLGAERVRAGE